MSVHVRCHSDLNVRSFDFPLNTIVFSKAVLFIAAQLRSIRCFDTCYRILATSANDCGYYLLQHHILTPHQTAELLSLISPHHTRGMMTIDYAKISTLPDAVVVVRDVSIFLLSGVEYCEHYELTLVFVSGSTTSR